MRDLITFTSVPRRLMTKHDMEGKGNAFLYQKWNRRPKPKLDANINVIMTQGEDLTALQFSIKLHVT